MCAQHFTLPEDNTCCTVSFNNHHMHIGYIWGISYCLCFIKKEYKVQKKQVNYLDPRDSSERSEGMSITSQVKTEHLDVPLNNLRSSGSVYEAISWLNPDILVFSFAHQQYFPHYNSSLICFHPSNVCSVVTYLGNSLSISQCEGLYQAPLLCIQCPILLPPGTKRSFYLYYPWSVACFFQNVISARKGPGPVSSLSVSGTYKAHNKCQENG